MVLPRGPDPRHRALGDGQCINGVRSVTLIHCAPCPAVAVAVEAEVLSALAMLLQC
jgi:hypothetical protein